MPTDPRAIERHDPKLAAAAKIGELERRLAALERKLSARSYPVGSENLRTVRGRVNMTTGGAAILTGSGFTVARTGVGLCTITFLPVFASLPALIATAETSVDGRVVTSQVASASSASVRIYNGTNLEDRAFDFIACG